MPISTKPRNYAEKSRKRKAWIDAGRPRQDAPAPVKGARAKAILEAYARPEDAEAPKTGWLHKTAGAVGRFLQRRRA